MPTQEYRIYSSLIPAAHSGDTVGISVSQSLTDGTNSYLETSQIPVFAQVQGPQTQLSESDIVGVYPAPNSNTSPDNYLPHIALSRRTLPWERRGPVADKKSTVPWLALLVLTDADMWITQNPTPIVLQVASQPVITPNVLVRNPGGPLPTPLPQIQGSLTPQSIKVSDLSTIDQATHKQLLTIPGITDETSINTLGIPAATLKKLLPTQANVVDLGLMCHVKEVIDNGQSTFASIVVSQRLPDASAAKSNQPVPLHTAVLVSLEQRTDIWGRLNNNEFINLIVLHSWTFTPSSQRDFKEVCDNIRYAPNGGVLRFGNLPEMLKQGDTNPLSNTYEGQLDTDGYLTTPLEHAEAGNVVWRGPLRPLQPPPRSLGVAISSAPEQWDKQPANTKLDYSHATAFELGKLLAIGDAGIRQDLRQIHAHFSVPDRYFAANNALPNALQRPYWQIDQGESLDNAQNELDAALASPWQYPALGANQSIIGMSNALGQGDFVGLAGLVPSASSLYNSLGTLANTVANQVANLQSQTPGVGSQQPGPIDLGATEATLVASLAQQFADVVNAASGHV